MKCRLFNVEGDPQTIRVDYAFGGESKHNFWQCAEYNASYVYILR